MTPRQGSFAALRRFVRPTTPLERCELCSQILAPEHPHLLELSTRKISCSCDACAVLFSGDAATRYRRIPRDGRFLQDFHLPDEVWDGLSIPINLVFFFHHSSSAKVVALYPSPAGATEALLPLTAWPALVEGNPILHSLQPDVEALLVNRVGEPHDCFLAPIDECFRLVGLIRGHWRGLSGGTEVWQEVTRFFTRLRERSQVIERAGSCPT